MAPPLSHGMFDGVVGRWGKDGGYPGSALVAPPHGHSLTAPAGMPQQDVEQDHAQQTLREDLLDQHVAYFLRKNPEARNKHRITRLRPGVYNINGREVTVDWQYADNPHERGSLIVLDGPLRQPFGDYLENTEANAEFDAHRLGRSSLQQIPKGQRLSFGDSHKRYSRLEAMKVAKEQALVREQAASFIQDGIEVPQWELMNKYKKVIHQRLGARRQEPGQRIAQPAEAPVAAPYPALLSESPSKAALFPEAPTRAPAQRTHGSPVYCANHDQSGKRKKVKPQNLECASCGTGIQTNYAEFLLCPTCSQREHRCMCCGASALCVEANQANAMTGMPQPTQNMFQWQNGVASQNMFATPPRALSPCARPSFQFLPAAGPQPMLHPSLNLNPRASLRFSRSTSPDRYATPRRR